MAVTAARIPDFSTLEINGENPTDENVAGCSLLALFSTPHFPLKCVHVLSHSTEIQDCSFSSCLYNSVKGNTAIEIIPTTLHRAT